MTPNIQPDKMQGDKIYSEDQGILEKQNVKPYKSHNMLTIVVKVLLLMKWSQPTESNWISIDSNPLVYW